MGLNQLIFLICGHERFYVLWLGLVTNKSGHTTHTKWLSHFVNNVINQTTTMLAECEIIWLAWNKGN